MSEPEPELPPVFDDLREESEELDRLVAGAGPDRWRLPTPAPRWTVAHQIAHLTWTDRAALLALGDADAFRAEVDKALASPDTFVDDAAQEGAAQEPDALLARWREGRTLLDRVLRDAAASGAKFPWYGPPMSAASMATGRLMETWAHGRDIADALGAVRPPTPTRRLTHIARIGVRARDFAFAAHGMAAPADEFRVELVGPGGEVWPFGPERAAQRVTGPVLDFCLLVTQRAHRDDLALRAEGSDADRWLDIAQAFAGPPGQGRAPGGSGHQESGA
ncbi:TIGR03084 family metal-binding protein [Streptomyces beihaiensis]|uniref:TIGR03084 family metal-binding protein n=1 Tax=Streptomyces beihaiensis TaxID=2984495 RepID=A0ABT3TUY2_9ACTN|nr:TIGR03084 family metal-binding protein [Streptomyces beihaiensis]MCX3060849.1 TIGR03084 family metal-binding protein [Streptomyces beihaiensis]